MFVILFLKILFWALNFGPHVSLDIVRLFFYSRFSSRKSQSQKKKQKILLNTDFAQKTSLILLNLTSFTLKVTCSPNTAKSFLAVYKFFSKHVSVCCQKKHLHCTISWRPRTAFSKHFESKCQYISVYPPKKNFVSKT